MSTHNHPQPRPAYRTRRAETLLERVGRIEFELVTAIIELRGLELDRLADSLNAELSHVQQIRTAAANQLRTAVAR